MHLWVMVALVIVLTTLESAVGSRIAIPELHADLVPVLVVAWGSLRGFEEGMLLGLVGGIMMDVVSGAPFGLHVSVLVLLGAVASTIDGQTVRASVGFIVSMGVLVTVGYHMTLMLGMQALGWQAFPPERFLRVLFPAAAANTLFLPIALLVSEHIYRTMTGWRQMEV
ncbi:MAG: rod shape-determining protein MreD [Chloroflexota bacterium]